MGINVDFGSQIKNYGIAKQFLDSSSSLFAVTFRGLYWYKIIFE